MSKVFLSNYLSLNNKPFNNQTSNINSQKHNLHIKNKITFCLQTHVSNKHSFINQHKQHRQTICLSTNNIKSILSNTQRRTLSTSRVFLSTTNTKCFIYDVNVKCILLNYLCQTIYLSTNNVERYQRREYFVEQYISQHLSLKLQL